MVYGGVKHRYVYLRGNKAERQILYKQIEDRIQPYPKMDIKKPDMTEVSIVKERINEQGYIQTTIFDYGGENGFLE